MSRRRVCDPAGRASLYDMRRKLLTLKEALAASRLDEFIRQAEDRSVGPVNGAELDRALASVIKPPRSEDRTSRSPSRDGSAET